MKAIIWAAVSTRGQAADGKGSIDEQIHEAHQYCKQAGWQIIDELIVPGFSRNYIDIHEFARNAANEGIYAPSKLLQHFQDNDFDVLMVRDGDRFGRTQTLFSHVVETVVKELGNQVYTFSDGLIDLQNYRMFIAMGGYRAAGEVDSLLKKQLIGYKANVKKGIPANATVVQTHKIVRDPQSGKIDRIIVDEDKRQEYLDLAGLLLDGVSWSKIEKRMYQLYGYVRADGKPHAPFTYYRILHTPSFWGHMATRARHRIYDRWTRDEGYKIPKGVTIEYDTHEPMYTGRLANKVKAELDRRARVKGKMKPSKTSMFSGLVICAECMYTMSYFRNGGYQALRCVSRWHHSHDRSQCTNKKYVNEKQIQRDLEPILMQILEKRSLEAYVNETDTQSSETTMQAIQTDIGNLQAQIETMIQKQAQAGASVRDIYEQQIDRAGERLAILKKRLQELKQDAILSNNANRIQQQVIQDIEVIGNGFWQQPATTINQQLHALLGDYRIVYDRTTFKGLALTPFA